MVTSSKVRAYDLSGDWFDMGVTLGQAEGLEIVRFQNAYFSSPIQLCRFGSMDKVLKLAGTIAETMRTCSESSFRFLEGLAEGAGLSFAQASAQAFLPELTHINNQADYCSPSCTACYVGPSLTSTGHALLAENWDFAVPLPEWYVLTLHPPADEPDRLIVGAGAMFACCGVNSLGIAATFTSSGHLPNVRPEPGLPTISRILNILDGQGFHEAMDLAVAIRAAGAANVLICDPYSHGALIETVPDHVEIIEHNTLLTCTNHFQHPGMVAATEQDLNPPDAPAQEFARSSVFRSEHIRDMLNDVASAGVTAERLAEILADHTNHPLSICAHAEGTILGFRTVGSVVLDPSQRSVSICPTQPCVGTFDLHSL